MGSRTGVQLQTGNKPSASSSEVRQGCFVCVQKYGLFVGRYSGFSPLTWSCPHSKPPGRPEFRISTYSFIISSCMSLLFLATACFNMYYITTFDFSTEKLAAMYLFNDTIDIIIAGVTSFFCLVQIRQRLREYSGMISIMENRALFGIDVMLEYKSARRIQMGTIILFSLASIGTVIMFGFYIKGVLESSGSPIHIFQAFMAYLSVFAVNVILLQFIASCYIYNVLFHELHNHLKTVLNPYRKSVDPEEYAAQKRWDIVEFSPKTFHQNPTEGANDPKTEVEIIKVPSGHEAVKKWDFIELSSQSEKLSTRAQVPLTLQLSRLRRLYASYIFNIKVLNEFYDPAKLVLVSLVLISMVINIYLVIMTQFEKALNGAMNLHSFMKLVGSLSATIFFFATADRIRISAQNISSFLYSYPISGLGSQEAGEIEMYLEMLNTQRPILSASGVFNIGTGLLASISGTVVTYVLVALQFQVVWQDDQNIANTTERIPIE